MGKCSFLVGQFIAVTAFFAAGAFNRPLFFRTSSFFDEPRFEKPHLTTLDLQLQSGYNSCAEVFQADVNFYQNGTRGFFGHIHLPVIALHQFHPKHSQELIDRCLDAMERTALSDSTLFIGWTRTFHHTEYLDFIDLTLKTGVLLPTGTKVPLNRTCAIPTGYNGHWGIPLSVDISVGAYDWITFGAHGDGLFLFNKKSRHHGEIDPGIVWRLGTYIKADHFFQGLSLLLAFSYEQKNRDRFTDCSCINANEQQRRGWHRTIFHFVGEYDFCHCESNWIPRIGVYYDHQISGKRVFDISMLGGAIGIDISWCY